MKKVVIISTNAIGDTYLSLSAVKPLREYFNGNCQIHLITHSRCTDLALLAGVDKIYAIDGRRISNFFQLYRQIKGIQFDYVFSFFPGRANSLISLLMRKKYFSGFRTLRERKNWWIDYQDKGKATVAEGRKFFWNSSETYLERIAKCLSAAHIPFQELCKPKFEQCVDKYDADVSFILLHCQSTQMERSLQWASVLKLLHFLYAKYQTTIRLVYWGELPDENIRQFEAVPFLALIKNSPLTKTISLICKAKLFIGVESFPIHLADGHNTNFIGIFGPSNPQTALQHPEKSILIECNSLYELEGEKLIEQLALKLQ